MSQAIQRKTTFADYLNFEDRAPDKHEFIDGRVIRMAGASEAHVLIVTNIGGELHGLLKGTPCRYRGADQKVYIPSLDIATYPDGVVHCGEAKLMLNASTSILLNPTVIFEVLSPSTENYDRKVKFDRYLEIESLREIVFVLQSEYRIELYTREPGELFRIRIYNTIEHSLRLESLQVEIPLRDIYKDVVMVSGDSSDADLAFDELP